MSISTADSIEGDFTTADKMKANNIADMDKEIDKASKEAKADSKMDYENVKGVNVSFQCECEACNLAIKPYDSPCLQSICHDMYYTTRSNL